SMALMGLALQDLGCPAISFTGSQAGIFTDEMHGAAILKELKPVRVEQELERGRVVVLAGFQGVNPVSKEVTTLGRGGSDTTAIAMAEYFKADVCEFWKTVPGIMTANPEIIPEARLLPKLDYSTLFSICCHGARIIHAPAAERALQSKIPMTIGDSRS